MALWNQRWSQTDVLQAGGFVVVSTLVLTASFLGIVGLVTGQVTGLDTRLPFYVPAMAVAFVGAVFVFDGEFRDGLRILQSAVLGAVVVFVLALFGGEGIAYAARNPGRVVASDLLFYILAAGLIGTGLGYWALEHWREVVGNTL